MKALLLLFLFVFLSIQSAQSQASPSYKALSYLQDDLFSHIQNEDPPWPPDWFYPHNPAAPVHAVIVFLEANPRINNIPILPGDYIGIFFTDTNGELKCGGGGVWHGSENVGILAYGDETGNPEKTGFVFAEQMYFKVFSWQNHKDYDVDIYDFKETSLSTDKWYPLGISDMIEIQALEDFDFFISMSENPICAGDQLVLSAEEFIGTTGNYTFSWTSEPPGFNHTVQFPPPIIPTENTTFFLSVSDGILTSQHQRTLLINENPTVELSNDGTICEGQNFSVSATATNYSSFLWSTSGDGNFSQPTAFQTNYIPGNADKANGQVILTFTASPLSPCLQSVSEDIALTIQKLPSLDAGPDITGCRPEASSLPMGATATNYSNVQWTTNGDGTFSDPNSINPLYYPGTNDYNSAFLQLTVCIEAISPCVLSLCDNFLISFINGPTCNAPNSRTRCADLPVSLAGTAANYSLIEWTTQGDGFFNNPNVFNAQYTAGPQDQQNEGNIVTLNALPISPCIISATKDVNIIWKPIPTLETFGSGSEFICPGNNYLQLNAAVNNYSSLLWTTSGDGTFSATSALNPKYYPGTQDYQQGEFELHLTAGPVSPCSNSYTFSQTTIIAQQPVATIVTANGTASCGAITLEASATSASAVLWQTSGDGTFSDAQAHEPVYYPGAGDINTSTSIQLSFTAFPFCTQFNNSIASVQLFFNDDATTFAGDDASICATDNYHLLQATASNYQDLHWTTNGDGTFSNQHFLQPVYYPGTADQTNGNVVLTITGSSILPCTFTAVDQLSLSLLPVPEVNAGSNSTICENNVLPVSGAGASGYSQLNWTTSGDGYFSNTSILNPEYYPGNADITAGSVELTLSATGITPCNFIISDQQILTIEKLPAANAGSDVTVCGTTVLNGTASNFSSVLWTTSGDGTFSNPGAPVTAYFPGASDLANQFVTVELTAIPLNFCTVTATDQKNILFNTPTIIEDNVTATEVLTSETLQLELIVSHPELGEFSWFKDDELLEEFNTGVLIKTDIEPIDAGIYRCTFTNSCGSISSDAALIEVLEPATGFYTLTEGWQGISSWFLPDETDIPTLFESITNQIVIIQNENGFWQPQQSINTIGPWSNEIGFALKVSENVTLQMSGMTRYPQSGITVQPGWSYFSVKSSCPVNVADLFSAVSEIEVIKDIAGYQLYWPEFGINTMIYLEPGKAYQLLNTGAAPLEINFPSCD